MTVTDQIKILDKKIMQNEAQYDLDRKTAKISALSSNNLDKYEYLTGEDLGIKPSTVEQARFEYSPLGKIFNNGLNKDDQKEGIFKRQKILEAKMKNSYKQLNIKEINNRIQLKILGQTQNHQRQPNKSRGKAIVLLNLMTLILQNLFVQKMRK